MKEVSGVVAKVWSKEFDEMIFGIILDGVDGLFKCGNKDPEVVEGQQVTIKIDENNFVKGIKRGEVGNAPAPKKKPYGGGGKNNNPSARNEYWENKESRDIDNQKIISYQAAANTALGHTRACFELGFLKAKKDQTGADAFDAVWRERTKDIYRMYQSIPRYYDKIMTGPEVFDEVTTGRQEMIDQINEDDSNNSSNDDPWDSM